MAPSILLAICLEFKKPKTLLDQWCCFTDLGLAFTIALHRNTSSVRPITADVAWSVYVC